MNHLHCHVAGGRLLLQRLKRWVPYCRHDAIRHPFQHQVNAHCCFCRPRGLVSLLQRVLNQPPVDEELRGLALQDAGQLQQDRLIEPLVLVLRQSVNRPLQEPHQPGHDRVNVSLRRFVCRLGLRRGARLFQDPKKTSE